MGTMTCTVVVRDMHGSGSGAGTRTVDGLARRAEDVLELQRAARTGGTAQLLRWLAVRSGAAVVLVDRSGLVVSPPSSRLGDTERDLILCGVRQTAIRSSRSVAIDRGDLACVVLPLGGPADVGTPLLAAVVPRPISPDLPLLLADAKIGRAHV